MSNRHRFLFLLIKPKPMIVLQHFFIYFACIKLASWLPWRGSTFVVRSQRNRSFGTRKPHTNVHYSLYTETRRAFPLVCLISSLSGFWAGRFELSPQTFADHVDFRGRSPQKRSPGNIRFCVCSVSISVLWVVLVFHWL